MADTPTLELAAACMDVDAADTMARRLGGRLYHDERQDESNLPFRALVTVVTDDAAALAAIADVGCYVICRRVIKPGTCSVFGLFPLVRRAELTHAEADAHWRDVHALLALEHHAFMTRYEQLSVVHRLSGLEVDGFALCGFESVEALRTRFYTTPESRAVIAADVGRMADTKRSPRRLIALETSFAPAGEADTPR